MTTPGRGQPHPLHYFVMSGSPRRTSVNTSLAQVVAGVIESRGGTQRTATIADFDMPLYDQDEQDARGFPRAAERLREEFEQAHGVVLVSPEYNASFPGRLKNALDWLSRFRPQPFAEKQMLLLSASPSMSGGNRGLWGLRIPLEHLGARVYPDMFSLAQATRALADGRLIDAMMQSRLEGTVGSFMDLAEAATHYACAKHVWVEFLGEPAADPEIARAE